MNYSNKEALIRVRDTLATVAVIAAATGVCAVLRLFTTSEIMAPLIFVLAVLIISRLTDGMVYGIVASVIAVFIINFAFTYPILAINFTITTYPFTFITMFVVSFITSTLTTQIKQQQKMRADAEREKLIADFLRSISHDLRTPLTSIIGSTSAILDSGASIPEDQKRLLLSEIRDDAAWLIRMVENILSITRIQGEVKMKKHPEPLEELTGAIIGNFKKRYPDAPVSVSIPTDLVFVPVDATLIEQVVMNLLENAVLHAVGLTRIDFEAKVEGKEVVIAITNDGAPVDADALQKNIRGDFFVSGKAVGPDSSRSLGIGLSVCASIVKAHGGRMFIRSNAGGGVVAGFHLPLWEGGRNENTCNVIASEAKQSRKH